MPNIIDNINELIEEVTNQCDYTLQNINNMLKDKLTEQEINYVMEVIQHRYEIVMVGLRILRTLNTYDITD